MAMVLSTLFVDVSAKASVKRISMLARRPRMEHQANLAVSLMHFLLREQDHTLQPQQQSKS